MDIILLRSGETVRYAADELKKYLRLVHSEPINVKIVESGEPAEGPAIRLGRLSDFGLSDQGVLEPDLDDLIDIDIDCLDGRIAGSNDRSILIGVYRYLKSAGCRWVRPGPDGEYLPKADLMNHSFHYRHLATSRIRGQCIEGGVSFENMLDNIQWAPKVGMNSYFLEFIVPYVFFHRWYDHIGSTRKAQEPYFTHERAADYTRILEREIKRCGLLLHSAGHGWTCEPFDIPGTDWDRDQGAVLPESARKYLAEIGGERDLFRGVPLNTNLCYSNPEARAQVVRYAAQYARQKPFVDYLHIWLADGVNNHCECDECRKKSPADYYITLLNEMDAEFTRQNIPMRLVFILYVDLLWPPKTERLNNPDRFTLLFAPITRTYSEPYTARPYAGELPEYDRNHLVFPENLPENLAYLRKWKEFFKGDAFVYEYYFYVEHCYDPGFFRIGKIIEQDISAMPELGLCGVVSDQTQRSFMPTGLAMCLMGERLFDSAVTLESLAPDHLRAEFGPDAEACGEFLRALSQHFNPDALRGGRADSPKSAAGFERSIELIDEFFPVIERNKSCENRCHAASWTYLSHHAQITRRFAEALLLACRGEVGRAREAYDALIDHISCIEDEIQPVFDLSIFVLGTKHWFLAATEPTK